MGFKGWVRGEGCVDPVGWGMYRCIRDTDCQEESTLTA